MTDPKTLTDEQAAWQLINPTGHVVATETSCVKAWARIGGYKPTVEALLGCEEAGWRVERATREQTASTGEPTLTAALPCSGDGLPIDAPRIYGDEPISEQWTPPAAPVEQAGSPPLVYPAQPCGKEKTLPGPVDEGCICRGNWRAIVKETEHLLDRAFTSHDGEVFTFYGAMCGSDDYYYVMAAKGELRMLSCVGDIESYGYALLPEAPADCDSKATSLEPGASEQDAKKGSPGAITFKNAVEMGGRMVDVTFAEQAGSTPDPMAGLRGMTAEAAEALIRKCAAQAGFKTEGDDFLPEGWNLLYRVVDAAHKAGGQERDRALTAGSTPDETLREALAELVAAIDQIGDPLCGGKNRYLDALARARALATPTK